MLGLKYKKARQELATNDQFTTVDNRPYYPNLYADASPESIANVCCTVLGMENLRFPDLNVSVVSGGITNNLYRVSGFRKLGINESFDPSLEDSVLVRIFGGEGMIDRDEETATYAALCDAKIAYRYLGRFGNGRLEGWLEGFRPLQVYELSKPQISRLIAEKVAALHTQFDLPGLKDGTKPKPGLFEQLGRWMNQALNVVDFPFRNKADAVRADSLFNLKDIESELSMIQTGDVIPPSAEVAFCQ